MPNDLDDILDASFAALSKQGGMVAKPDIAGDISRTRNTLTGTIADTLGLPDAMRALRGELTPDEAQHFAMTAALGLLPGSKAENALMKSVAPVANKLEKYPNLMRGFAKLATKGDVPDVIASPSGKFVNINQRPTLYNTEIPWQKSGGTYHNALAGSPYDPEIEKALAKNPGASIFDIAGHSELNEKPPRYEEPEEDALHQGPHADPHEHLRPVDWNELTHPYGAKPGFEDVALRERARQLGFNVELPLYKGGALHDYPEELRIPKKSYEKGLFFADTPNVASHYTSGGSSPLEYVARAENPLEVHWPDVHGSSSYSESTMHAIIEAAREKKADLLVVKNITDLGGKQNQYIALDPSILRAPSAQFDPSKLKQAAPLAGFAGVVGTQLLPHEDTGMSIDNDGNMRISQ